MTESTFYDQFARFTLGKRIVAVHFHPWGNSSFDLRFDDGSILEVHMCKVGEPHFGFGLVQAEYVAEFGKDTKRGDYWGNEGRTYWLEDK